VTDEPRIQVTVGSSCSRPDTDASESGSANTWSRRVWGRFRSDDSGTGVVAALTLMFVFTAGALIWLSRDVDRADQARSDANSIAFQAARAGAQQVQGNRLFDNSTPVIDPDLARAAVSQTTSNLLAKFGESGSVAAVIIEGDRVTVTVVVDVAGRTAHGTGSARARAGVNGPERT